MLPREAPLVARHRRLCSLRSPHARAPAIGLFSSGHDLPRRANDAAKLVRPRPPAPPRAESARPTMLSVLTLLGPRAGPARAATDGAARRAAVAPPLRRAAAGFARVRRADGAAVGREVLVRAACGRLGQPDEGGPAEAVPRPAGQAGAAVGLGAAPRHRGARPHRPRHRRGVPHDGVPPAVCRRRQPARLRRAGQGAPELGRMGWRASPTTARWWRSTTRRGRS